jgi:hypothetical protein
MKKALYIFSLLFVMTNCKQTNETKAEEKLLLIAFVTQNLEANQRLGWKIINDNDIINKAKKKYDLVILDINNYKIPNNGCASNIKKDIEKNRGENFFVIANRSQCWFSTWKISDKKQSVIEKLGVGNGP